MIITIVKNGVEGGMNALQKTLPKRLMEIFLRFFVGHLFILARTFLFWGPFSKQTRSKTEDIVESDIIRMK